MIAVVYSTIPNGQKIQLRMSELEQDEDGVHHAKGQHCMGHQSPKKDEDQNRTLPIL